MNTWTPLDPDDMFDKLTKIEEICVEVLNRKLTYADDDTDFYALSATQDLAEDVLDILYKR